MSPTSLRSKTDVVVIGLFLTLSVVAFLGALSTIMLSLVNPQAPFYDLGPFFFGLSLAAGGSAAMVAMRGRYQIVWPILLITIVLWMMGAVILSFGLSAVFYYDQRVDFDTNVGYVVGLCIGPGLLLAAIGQLLYGFEAWRGMKQRREGWYTAVSANDLTPDWLKSLKAAERARLNYDE
ncbi:MAG: hypothetical protein IPM39_05930 [Chloroflexi bacterium]|nr:hypothetical protein [Chloroflexota bacterium]